MKDIEVSVIIPAYNVEKYISRCVDSILAQTFANFELLIIDDGSSDSTAKILDEYTQKDDRIHVFHIPNGGASSARNYGLRQARGRYVTFADADDYVESNWLSCMVSRINDVDLVIQGFYFHKNDVTIAKCLDNNRFTIDEYPLECYKLLNLSQLGYLWSMLFKSSIINENNLRMNNGMTFQEDLDFILRYILHTKSISTISSCNYHYFYVSKNYRHSLSGCYAITSSLTKILDKDQLSEYEKEYSSIAFNTLLNNNSHVSIKKAIKFSKLFGSKCNGMKAKVISWLLRIPCLRLSSFLISVFSGYINRHNGVKK